MKNEINKKEKEKLQWYLLGLSAGVGPCDAAGARRQKQVTVWGRRARERERERERISKFLVKAKLKRTQKGGLSDPQLNRVRKTFNWDTKTKFYFISAKILLFFYFIFNDIHTKKIHCPSFFFFLIILFYKYEKC